MDHVVGQELRWDWDMNVLCIMNTQITSFLNARFSIPFLHPSSARAHVTKMNEKPLVTYVEPTAMQTRVSLRLGSSRRRVLLLLGLGLTREPTELGLVVRRAPSPLDYGSFWQTRWVGGEVMGYKQSTVGVKV
jgi:hypothetical protein